VRLGQEIQAVPRPSELRHIGSVQEIDVIVGILVDGDSRVLIAERPAGKHMAGSWEFPGGKLMPGEPPLDGLKRELAEELGVLVEEAEPFLEHAFRYPDRLVRLDVWWIRRFSGRAVSCEGQALCWCDAEALSAAAMLPADVPLVAAVIERLRARA
jgi:8-oxo-dGTP diphosphatase